MKIGFAGDWHGHSHAALYALDKFAGQGVQTVVQVGDFGFSGLKAGTLFHDYVQGLARKRDQRVYVTPGNHEDYDYLDTIHTEDDGWGHIRRDLFIAPRGHRWTWGGRTFVGMGGAASVDRTWRLAMERSNHNRRKMWWAQEAVSDDDVERTIAGGFADVMITHEAPILPAIHQRIKNNPHGFAENDIKYSNEVAMKVHKAAHGVMPTLLFHGHHHFFHDSIKHWASYDTGYFSTRDIRGTTRVIGLNLEWQPQALAILDTEDMSVVVF